MEKKVLVLTSNEEKWGDCGISETEKIVKLKYFFKKNDLLDYSDIRVLFIYDNKNKEQIKGIIGDKKIIPNFIALHNTAYEKDKTAELDYKNCVVKDNLSHGSASKNFYKLILNKILDESLKLEDVEKFFKSVSLETLILFCKLNDGVPTKEISMDDDIYSDIEKETFNKLKKDIESDSYTSENEDHISLLTPFRVALNNKLEG